MSDCFRLFSFKVVYLFIELMYKVPGTIQFIKPKNAPNMAFLLLKKSHKNRKKVG